MTDDKIKASAIEFEKAYPKIAATIRSVFLQEKRSSHCEDGPLKIYVRGSRRKVPKQDGLQFVFDLATIDVDAEHRSQGHFTKFFTGMRVFVLHIRNYYSVPINWIFVENVFEERFQKFFANIVGARRESYDDNFAPCFFIPILPT